MISILNEYSPVNPPSMNSRPIPNLYREVDYIQGTGTQYIQLNFPLSTKSKSVVVCDGINTEGEYIFGCGTRYNYRAFAMGASGDDFMSVVFDSVEFNFRAPAGTIGVKTTYTLDKGSIYVNGDFIYSLPGTVYPLPVSGRNTCLFAANIGGSIQGKCSTKIYGAKFYNDDVLISDLVPCVRSSDNVAGLYDITQQQFFTNAGTGSFKIPDNDLIINAVLPSRKTINIYGVWDGTEYVEDKAYWMPSSIAKITNPATIISGLGTDTRVIMTPDNPDIRITNPSYIQFKGLAKRETVEDYLRSNLYNTEYEEIVNEEWDVDINEEHWITDNEGNFEFTIDQYGNPTFPFELLFECPIDTQTVAEALVFETGSDFGSEDMFAIYERKNYTYTFYKPDGTVYTTQNVLYGESPVDPMISPPAPIPSSVTTRYILTSSTSGGVTTYTATEDSTSTTGDFIYSRNVVDTTLGRTWREYGATPAANDWVTLTDYVAGTPNQTTSFSMREIISVPVVFVIDGVAEGFAGSYGINGGVDPVTGYELRNYGQYYDYTNNDTWHINLNSGTSRARLPQVYEDELSSALIKDESIGWFYDADCYLSRTSNGQYYYSMDDRPVILYTKLRDVRTINFTGLSTGSLAIDASNLTLSEATYSYANGVILYKRARVVSDIDDKIYVTEGTALTATAILYTRSTNTEISCVDTANSYGYWYRVGYPSSQITGRFEVSGTDVTLQPMPVTYSKPKMRISIDSSITADLSNVDADTYLCTTTSSYIDVIAKAATTANISAAWQFDMTQFSFTKTNYTFTGYTPASPSVRCGSTVSVTLGFEINGYALDINPNWGYFNNSSYLNSLDLYHSWTVTGSDWGNPVNMNNIGSIYTFTNIKVINSLSVEINSSEPLAEFAGFSYDQAGNNMVTFPLTLAADTTLYAQYQPVTYTLRYYYGDTNFCDQEVSYDPISGQGEIVDMSAIDPDVSTSWYPAINWDGKGIFSPSVTTTLYRYGTPSSDSTTKTIGFKNVRASYGALGTEYAVGSDTTYVDISTNLNLVDYVDTYSSTRIIPIHVKYKINGRSLSEDYLDARWIAYKGSGSLPEYYYWAYAPNGESSPSTAVAITNDTRTTSAGYFELINNAKYLMFEKSGAIFSLGANWGWELLYDGNSTQSIDMTRYVYGQQTISVPRLGTEITCRYSTGLSIEGIIPIYPDSANADDETLPSDYKNDGIHSHIMRAFPLNANISTYHYRNKGVCAPSTYTGYWRKGNNDYGYISKYSSAFNSWFWFEPVGKTAHTSGSVQINSGTINTYYLCVPVEMGSVQLNSYTDPTDFRYIELISVECIDSWLNSHRLSFYAPFYPSSSSQWSDGIHYPNRNYNQSAFTDFIYVKANGISSVSGKIDKIETDGLNLLIREEDGFYKVPSGKRNSSFLTAIDGVIYMLMLYTEQQ